MDSAHRRRQLDFGDVERGSWKDRDAGIGAGCVVVVAECGAEGMDGVFCGEGSGQDE